MLSEQSILVIMTTGSVPLAGYGAPKTATSACTNNRYSSLEMRGQG